MVPCVAPMCPKPKSRPSSADREWLYCTVLVASNSFVEKKSILRTSDLASDDLSFCPVSYIHNQCNAGPWQWLMCHQISSQPNIRYIPQPRNHHLKDENTCKSDRTSTVTYLRSTVARLRVQTFQRSNRIQYILASSRARQFQP